jgi:hypothetical protein
MRLASEPRAADSGPSAATRGSRHTVRLFPPAALQFFVSPQRPIGNLDLGKPCVSIRLPQVAVAKTPATQTALQHQIDAIDRQIDQLVYQLYGLTDDEIKIVEEATP